MVFFTNEEFDIMFREIVVERPICYDTMLTIAERMLKGTVCKWCNDDAFLHGEDHIDEVMQLIRIRLYQKCVTGFFMRNGEPNYDPEGFKNWIFKVALNVKRDYAKKVRQQAFREGNGAEDFEPVLPPDGEVDVSSDEELEKLSRSFQVVIGHSSKVHIVLSWLATMLLVAVHGISKIEATDLMVRSFDSMTLDSMLEMILRYSSAIPWLCQEENNLNALKERLNKTDQNGVRLGDKVYHDFYMKKGAKASVSDWIYRMNQIVEIEEENRK